MDVNICAYTSEATNAVSASVIKQPRCTIFCCGINSPQHIVQHMTTGHTLLRSEAFSELQFRLSRG